MIELYTLKYKLPPELFSYVQSFIPNQWKHRFSVDVVSSINKGWRWAGIVGDSKDICNICFCFGIDVCRTCSTWDYVSYDAFTSQRLDWWNNYLPWHIFEYMHPLSNTNQITFYDSYTNNMILLKNIFKFQQSFDIPLNHKQILHILTHPNE